MGVRQKWLVYGTSNLEMDENWGYPHFRKPPNLSKKWEIRYGSGEMMKLQKRNWRFWDHTL